MHRLPRQARANVPGRARCTVLLLESSASAGTEADLHRGRLHQAIGDDHVAEWDEHGLDEHGDVREHHLEWRVNSEDAVDVLAHEDRVLLEVAEDDELSTDAVLPGRDEVALCRAKLGSAFADE